MKESTPEDAIDIKALFFKLLEKWYFFVISLIICVSLAYLKKVQTTGDSLCRWNFGQAR